MISKNEIRMALDALFRHKLRTGLTLLGMLFGVGAVVAMLSIGEGAQREAESVADRLGVRNLIVQSKSFDREELERIRTHSLGLRLQDADEARRRLPFVSDIAGEKRIATYDVHSAHTASQAEVIGVTQQWPEIAQLSITKGRFWSQDEDGRAAQVAVLGASVAAELYGDASPIGSLLRVNHAWFVVVGVADAPQLKTTELRGVKLADDRARIFLPLNTSLTRLYIDPLESELDTMRLRLSPGVSPKIASAQVERLFQDLHGGKTDIEIVVPAALLETQERTQRIFTMVLSCIAGISLLVGGIGIMNVMLASVVERTHEIGLMRAVGARTSDVARQFLVEGALLSLTGGLAGIAFGVALAMAATLFTGWSMAFSASTAVIALALCFVVGLAFCIYPALQAARMDPIAALRKEMG
jgi:putative ABC transport system permease protein